MLTEWPSLCLLLLVFYSHRFLLLSRVSRPSIVLPMKETDMMYEEPRVGPSRTWTLYSFATRP